MTTIQTTPNPFALMMDPEAVFAAMARSERLSALASRICRPLDRPLTGRTDASEASPEVSASDDDEIDGDRPEELAPEA